MDKDFSLPFQPGFKIDARYALLVGATVMMYARFESTVVDIIGFYEKGYRSGYYCKDMLMPSNLISDLSKIGKPEDKEDLKGILEGFREAVNLRNAISHSVPCGGPNHYDVLLFQQGIKPRFKDNIKKPNPYLGVCFDYDLLLGKAKRMSEAYLVASKFFYALRDRVSRGEEFSGEPC